MTLTILNTNAVLTKKECAPAFHQDLVIQISLGLADEPTASMFAMNAAFLLSSSINLASSVSPSEMTRNETRVFLKNIDAAESYAKSCAGVLYFYPKISGELSEIIKMSGYANALVSPTLMLGNSDAITKKFKSVCTYIIQSPESGLIKIGRSKTPLERIKSLETGSGCKLVVLAIIEKDIEQLLHKKFSDLRAFGEWFSDDGRISSYADGSSK